MMPPRAKEGGGALIPAPAPIHCHWLCRQYCPLTVICCLSAVPGVGGGACPTAGDHKGHQEVLDRLRKVRGDVGVGGGPNMLRCVWDRGRDEGAGFAMILGGREGTEAGGGASPARRLVVL